MNTNMESSSDIFLKCDNGEKLLGYVFTLLGISQLAIVLYCFLNEIDLHHNDFIVASTFFLIGISQSVLSHTLKISVSLDGIAYQAYFKSFRIEKSNISYIEWSDKIGFRRSRGIEFLCGDQIREITLQGLSDIDKIIFIDYIRANYAEIDQRGWENLSDYYEQLKSRTEDVETQTPALLPALAAAEIALILLYLAHSISRQGSLKDYSYSAGLIIFSLVFIPDAIYFAGVRWFDKPLMFRRFIPLEYRKRATIILLLTLLTCMGLGFAGMLDALATFIVIVTCITFLIWVFESRKFVADGSNEP